MRRQARMRNGTWLEVALNGPWGRDAQPGIPVRVDDIVAQALACVREGAAIVHVHAYDEASGRQRDDADLYARIVEGIRARADCIVYPTIPFAADGTDAAARFAAVEALAARGLLEWAVVDPGSVNFDRFVYLNPNEHIRHGLALAARYGFHPSYAIYEPGFLRHGARLAAEFPGLPAPVYRFMFSEGFAFGFPPAAWALEAYLRLLAECAPGAPWMIAGLAVDILPLVPEAVARGGHVRVGLEDAPFATPRSNVEWVRAARAAIERAGGRLASAAEVRRALDEG
ncbi:MAG: 3-keto-5-aminohexanoate cleavage protein [Burkholderiales bacterium]|nr:3-keto-5-aminohexanoate cleavage protein [Burkholderiales bacterium]